MIRHYIQNGKKYYSVFLKTRDRQGKQINRRRKGIASERKAREIEYQLLLELKELAGAETPWSFKDWHEECLKRMKLTHKLGTIQGYDGALKAYLRDDWQARHLADFSRADVHELIHETMNTASANLRKNTFKKIQRLFEMAVEEGLISKNPAHGIQVKVPEPKQTVLNTQEAEVLLQKAKEIGHRFYTVWAFALMTGMRSGEMFALRWCDIDFETGFISVNKQWTSKDGLHETKANRNRVVPISPELARFLRVLRAEGEQTDTLSQGNLSVTHKDYVLPRLEEWKHGEQAQVLRDFCRAIGITEVKFHDLRATFITNMLSQGVPLVAVMAIVGHRKMSTTDRYLRFAGVGIKGATENLGYRLPQVEGENVIRLCVTKS